MKKIKLTKEGELYVARQFSVECDFCGDKNKEVFTSEHDEVVDCEKSNVQVCVDCVKQLAKLIYPALEPRL